MSSGPYDDGTGHQRRRHPAVDRGHQVLRDSQGDWDAGYPDTGHGDGGYGQQPTQPAYPTSPYGDDGGYTPSFIERGFGDDVTEPRTDPRSARRGDTGGRAGRAAGENSGRIPRTDPGGRSGRSAGGDTTGGRLAAGRSARDNTDPRARRGEYDGRGGYSQGGQPPVYGAGPEPGYGGDQGYGQGGGYQTGGYQTGGYPQGGYDARGYDQGGYDRNGYDQGGYDQGGYDRNGYDQGGYPQGGGYGNTSYDEYEEPVGKETPRRRGRSAITFVVAIAMLAAIGGIGLFGYKFYVNHFTTPDYSGMGTGTVYVTVHDGDSASVIAETLYKADVVKSTKAFIAAADANPDSRGIQVSTYALHKQMSAVNALNMLLATKDGQPLYAVNLKVTIPETDISVDIYAALSKATGIPQSEFINAAKDPVALGVDPAWFNEKRDDGRANATVNEKGFKYPATIEGFLFPATYTFEPGESASDILKQMVTKFNQVTGASGLNFIKTAQSKHLVPYEALIAASIAQHEAETPADMAGVAQVMWNRLHKQSDTGTVLGLDSELNYWLRMTGQPIEASADIRQSQLNSKSDPYNTHVVGGYPPGPVGNPGEDALKAALTMDPSKAADFYFQTLTGSPKVVFAKTCLEAAHQRGQSHC